MNFLILNKYGITFQKQENGNIKINADSKTLDNFLYMFCRDKQKLERFILILNQVLNYGFDSILEQDKYWDIEIGIQVYTGIINNNMEFDLYFENDENETYPISDIKEIFSSLSEFIA